MLIPGVQICSLGIAAGHGLVCDQTLLSQLETEVNKAGKVICKLNHRTGLESVIGFVSNARIQMGKLVGDLQLLEENKNFEFVRSLIENFSKKIGLSPAFCGSQDTLPDGRQAARCKPGGLNSVDLVESPANPSQTGLFEATVNGARFEFEMRPDAVQRAASAPSVAEVRALTRRIRDLQIRFARIDRRRAEDEPSIGHDLTVTTASGAIEGGAGILAVDPLLKKLGGEGWVNPLRKGVIKRVAGGAAIGAILTGTAGLAVSEFLAEKRRRERGKMIARTQKTDAGLPNLPAADPTQVGPFSAKTQENLFDSDSDAKRNKLLTGAGVASIAGGAALFPAARRLIGIKARQIGAKNLGIKSAAKNLGGKTVADYIGAAQAGLNTGFKGRLVGHTIEHVIKHPEGAVAKAFAQVPGAYGSNDIGQRLASEHFARFRASPMSALHFWDYEQSLHSAGKIAKQDAAAAARGKPISDALRAHRKATTDELHYGREKAHAAIKEQVEVHGKNEMDAIKHVAYHHDDPQVQGYFDRLAMTKASAVDEYSKKALYSPALIAGGGAAIIAGRKKDESPAQAIEHRIKFSSNLSPDEKKDRGTYRVAGYKYKVENDELKRAVGNYTKSTLAGAGAGALVGSLKGRAGLGAAIGALSGAGSLTAIRAAMPADRFGQRSPAEHQVERLVPAAALVAGLIAGRRKLKNVSTGAKKLVGVSNELRKVTPTTTRVPSVSAAVVPDPQGELFHPGGTFKDPSNADLWEKLIKRLPKKPTPPTS